MTALDYRNGEGSCEAGEKLMPHTNASGRWLLALLVINL